MLRSLQTACAILASGWGTFDCRQFPSRQIHCLPIHRHADACATAGMVEKDELFEWRWIEFAIDAEFQRDFCHTVRLARSVDSKRICFSFRDAYHRIEK